MRQIICLAQNKVERGPRADPASDASAPRREIAYFELSVAASLTAACSTAQAGGQEHPGIMSIRSRRSSSFCRNGTANGRWSRKGAQDHSALPERGGMRSALLCAPPVVAGIAEADSPRGPDL